MLVNVTFNALDDRAFELEKRARSRRWRRVVTVAGAVVCLGITSAHALTPGQHCAITKQKAIGKAAAAQLKCFAKAAIRDESIDPACLTKALDKLHVKFVSAIARGGCVFTNDVNYWDELDDFTEFVVDQHPGMAGSPAAQRCASRKWKTAGKAVQQTLRCHARSTVVDQPTDSACLAKAEGKLSLKFAKLDAAGGCVTSGDATLANDDNRVEVDYVVHENPARPKWAFLTGGTWDGAAVGGLAGGDAHCAGEVSGTGLPGTYVAWLSTSGTFARNRLAHDPTIPYALVDGTRIADSANDLSAGILLHAIDRNASGALLGADYVWTGTQANGNTAPGETCSDWTSNAVAGRRGSSGASSGAWTYDSTEVCAAGRRLYCFEY